MQETPTNDNVSFLSRSADQLHHVSEQLHERCRSGELVAFVGVGITKDGDCRFFKGGALNCGTLILATAGSLDMLKDEVLQMLAQDLPDGD